MIEVRKNYKDEIQIRLEMSMFLFANDMPSIDPPDAYQTMLGFQFLSEFREKADINDPSSAIQKNWRLMDGELKRDAAESQEERFARMVQPGDKSDVVF